MRECEQYTGRKREICRGEAGLPLDGPHSTNSYRRSWGLPPLGFGVHRKRSVHTVEHEMKPPVDDKLGRYPGTNLAVLLRRFKVKVRSGCNCEEWIDNMNRWGWEGCQERRSEIVERLKDQARKLREQEGVATVLWSGILMVWNRQWPTVEGLVDQAIRAAREACAEP